MIPLLALQLTLSFTPVPRQLHLLPPEAMADHAGPSAATLVPFPANDRNRGSFGGGEWLGGIQATLALDGIGGVVSAVMFVIDVIAEGVYPYPDGAYQRFLPWLLSEWIAVAVLQPLILTGLEGAIAPNSRAGADWLGLALGYAADAVAVGLGAYAVLVAGAFTGGAGLLLGALACHFLAVPLVISFGLHFPLAPAAAAPPPPTAESLERGLPPVRAVPVLALAF